MYSLKFRLAIDDSEQLCTNSFMALFSFSCLFLHLSSLLILYQLGLGLSLFLDKAISIFCTRADLSTLSLTPLFMHEKSTELFELITVGQFSVRTDCVLLSLLPVALADSKYVR